MKAWKLQECVAHSPGVVTCVSLGRKSGRVMATGGEDRRVKLWAVGKPACILSLTGHTSSVEATEFSQEEDRVAAGSLSGSIRIWDLEEVKIVRALSGHTSAVSSLDFHPFGNFVVSGSIDTFVKLWDVSRKGCINTYRGHSGGVNMARFSPDGKWVVSAGEDGMIKLWDLSAGRLLAELTGHTGSVTAVAFHPTVLLLATASTDRTVRLFDLENFSQVAVSGTELAGSVIRRIAFHPDGVCLYVATLDYLKIYDYETMTCLETVSVGWRNGGGLDDMAIAPSFNQLVGASISNSTLSTFVVDIKSCIPFVDELPSADVPVQQSQQTPACAQAPPFGSSADNTVRPFIVEERPYTRCGSSVSNATHPRNRKSFCLIAEENARSTLQEDLTDPDAHLPYKPSADDQSEMASSADINDPEEYDRIFKPRRTVARSPSRAFSSANKTSKATPAPSSARRISPPETTAHSGTASISERSTANVVSDRNQQVQGQHIRVEDTAFVPPPIRRVQSTMQTKSSRPTSSPGITAPSQRLASDDVLTEFVQNAADSRLGTVIQATRADTPNVAADPPESEWLASIRKSHNLFMTVMCARVKGISTVRMMWTRDNIRTAVETALMMNEPAVVVDVLSILAQNSKLWNLELATIILPHLVPLIRSKYSRHVETTCRTVHIILKNFAQLIKHTLDGPAPPGVDLMREERQRKCQECMDHLLSIRTALETKEVASRAGQCGRELVVQFQTLS
ncbi:hypothetical protein CRM22_001002 [Opisthorchis felineus]|uniref:Katanin p80 WD40 repeat-containing subunit B1 n=1 Tax=Opisthorchis felineus TaxID=147828 RepID=A0A4V3SH03_OPIFE|nr:hypothetical protein CRM22_001002 [Opisthorchis felineus]TGZ74325.1 hypothetical protein CRM22_001002 [Opisthorchis felineus]